MLKPYSKEELTSILNNLAIDELAFSTKRWECTTVAEEGKSLFQMGVEERLQNISIYRARIKDYTEKANEQGMSKENANIYMRAVKLLEKLMTDDEIATMAVQKDLFSKENNLYNSRSYIEFPLDKKPELNALYDDFSGVFLFYDDISTLGNNKCALMRSYGGNKASVKRFTEIFNLTEEQSQKILSAKNIDERVTLVREMFGPDKLETFLSLEGEERRKFVEDNIEFTHCLLGGATNPNYGIGVYGDLDPTLSSFVEGEQMALPNGYCDFDKVTLADTLKIKNNDLLQMVQNKIDLDRENLEVVANQDIRGDNYQIKKLPEQINVNGNRYIYLIRYVCPSTGRVYHNPINEQMLTQSKYFKRGDMSTYIPAWWHINNGGDDPFVKEDVIRC